MARLGVAYLAARAGGNISRRSTKTPWEGSETAAADSGIAVVVVETYGAERGSGWTPVSM